MHKNNASAAKEMRQTSGLQQDVIIPVKICKKKTGSRTYFMQSKDYYVVTPLSKLLAKAYSMDERLKQNPELSFREFCRLNNITPRYLSSVLQLNNLSPTQAQTYDCGWLSAETSVDSNDNRRKCAGAVDGAGGVV